MRTAAQDASGAAAAGVGTGLEKSLQNFDVKRLPAKAQRQLRTLLEGNFLNRKENVLVFGPPDPETFCTSLLHH